MGIGLAVNNRLGETRAPISSLGNKSLARTDSTEFFRSLLGHEPQIDPWLTRTTAGLAQFQRLIGVVATNKDAAAEMLLLQALYSVRSERLLMEQLDYNLLFRWFVGLNMG